MTRKQARDLLANTAQTFDAKMDAISTATSSVLYGNYNMKTASAADMSFGTTTSNMTNPITTSRERMVQEMVQRFLGWKLPSDFNPDGGITFEPEFNVEYMAKQGKQPMRHEPTGTNLFTADQAEVMVRFILGDTALQHEAVVLEHIPVAFLRQWINEDLLKPGHKLVTDDDIRAFMKIGTTQPTI